MKVAVSIPNPIFEAAEKLAQERNQPRSQLYAEALESFLEAHGPESITERLNLIYETRDSSLDPALEAAQFRLIEDEAW